MDNPFTIHLPFYPPRLSLNNSQGWRSRHFKTLQSKKEFAVFVEEAIACYKGDLPIDPCEILIWVKRNPRRRVDLDNQITSMKGWQDVLVDLGVIPDDAGDNIRHLSARVTLSLPKNSKTLIEVCPIGRGWQDYVA